MTRTISDFYRGPTVWVEDAFTHEILTRLFGNVRLDIAIAHGEPAVRALVRATPEKQCRLVYGVVDRDFHAANSAQCHELRPRGRMPCDGGE